MALSDPQSLTIATLTSSLPKTEQERTANGYTTADGSVKLTVSHQYGRRNRSIVRIDFNKISADPLTDVKQKLSSSVYILVDRPPVGFTAVELKDISVSLTTWLTGTSNANLLKVLGGEF